MAICALFLYDVLSMVGKYMRCVSCHRSAPPRLFCGGLQESGIVRQLGDKQEMGGVWFGGKWIRRNIPVLALFPALSVIADYTLTFVFADGLDEILRYEFSPIARAAAVYDLVPLVVVGIALSYYVLSYLVLGALCDTSVYPFVLSILVVVSITHVMGGLSWLVRMPFCSNMVQGLSVMAFVLAVTGMVWFVWRCPRHLR